MHRLIAFLKKSSLENKRFAPEFAALNVKRISYGAFVAVIMHVILLIIYLFAAPYSIVDEVWHNNIVTTYIIMLAVMCAAFAAALLLRRRKKPGLPEHLLQYGLIVLLMAEGVILTYFDQLVTPNITPYLLLCLVVGVGFLARPSVMLVVFAVSYAAFFWAIDLRTFSHDVMFSNKTDGFVITCIGFAVSAVLWRYNILSARQRFYIQSQQKKLMGMAYLDPLTGLYNRRKFDEIVRQEIALSKDCESSLIMLDIDYFKEINDTFGHPAGDLVLIQLSRLLKRNLRKGDSLCRLGGEEFIILLPGTPEGEAVVVAENLRGLIENHIFAAGDKPVRLSASFGIARLDCNLDPTLISQYSAVDHALYIAKQNGRNRVIAV